MPIDVDAEGREFHLHNGRISYIVGVHDNGALGQLYFGPPSRPDGRTDTSCPCRSTASTTASARRSRSSTRRAGRATIAYPALVVGQPDGSTVLELAYVGHRITPGKPAITGLPATYVEADDEADTLEIDAGRRAERRRRHAPLHDLPGRADRRPQRPDQERGSGGSRAAMCHEPRARPAGCPLAACPPRRHVGPRAPRTDASARARAPVDLELPRRLVLEIIRSSRCDGPRRRGARRSDRRRLVYSGNFLAEVQVEPFETARLRIGIDPDTFGWRLEPGAEFVTPEAVIVYSDAGMGALSDALIDCSASGWRAARGETGLDRCWSTTGRAPTTTSTPADCRDGIGRPRPRDRAVRARRRLVRRARRRHQLVGRLVRRSAQAARWSRRPRTLDRGPRAPVRPVDRAGDGQPPQPVIRGAPGLGHRRTRPAADRGPAAARPRSRPIGGRRSPLRGLLGCPWRRADLVRQVGHEPEHHGAVQPRVAVWAPGRVLPSLHPRRL